ncbi:FMN-binding protein [Anaerocolumna sp.]|uniref:FMN-binding protein n=1 Tax=Anaerocolumna sp. TaxID=2041569 RepID=UPI0028A7A857|nr:FMN-binding protein [Anaerocolumna sp.]
MKKVLLSLLCLVALTSMVACSKGKKGTEEGKTPETSNDEVVTLTGTGKGFGGPITVTVKKQGDKIISVDAVGEKETQGIGTNALDQLPNKIVDANSTEVDVVTSATITSQGIIDAVNNALDPEKYPAPQEESKEPEKPEEVTAAKVFQGFGVSNMGRLGPGKDDTDTQVYSINQVFAHTLFDEEGKILSLQVDVLEVATPNYDGDGMPHFSGFPGQGGYNYDENHDGKVEGKTKDTDDNFLAEVNGWVTKRERGDAYRMNSGTWASEMDTYEKVFVGMTVEEVEQWFTKYTSDLNGRPLVADSDKPEDQTKYEKLTDDEKAMLVDVVSGATMSLNDGHGNIIEAIKDSYENRVGIDITAAASQGFAVVSAPRVGPGKDDTDTQVYSVSQVLANTLFDKDGKIVALYVDTLEYATPNYDGASMPHFTGFPGQAYNNDENHDGKVDGQITATDDTFLAEINSWVTKRDRGEEYRMGTGTWASQMDAFQKLFIGKTAAEVEEWFAKYTSDLNGRPLKADSDQAEDKAKYDKLTDDEKAMLVDVVSGATMSLNDSHGNIIGAIKKSFENRANIDLTIK